ncbi:dihydrolipoamide acetyltransferase family protein [Nevskia ramosa]|uniref:dihydrolipoamide acetyltransferase family protein n=1 Tax=Nevskia ramosa TaxID=64002 RepID=UPI0003B537E6|nr:dihydrolipoamide acetyltransferase family protein [Nevskia ramosa]
MSIFKLPDLGEGLQEADIREWHVKVGDKVAVDQPLVAVETAKAVVEVPSPQTGVIKKLYGAVGDTMDVGKPLVEFEGGETPATQTAPATDTPVATPAPDTGGARSGAITDTGTVVGAMRSSNDVVAEKATTVGTAAGLKVTPAVRALAHRLNVDLTIITPTGPDGMVTAADVQRVHKILTEVGPMEKLRGARKAMAQSMAQSRDEVMPATVTDDAVLHAWPAATKQDLTIRLIRAIVAGVKAEPALNAWYDQAEIGRRLLAKIHVGVAVDTPDGLFVAVLQDVASRSEESLRSGLQKMKEATRNRSLPPEELRGYTITLSNFGRFGGKYATPVIVPPTVAIVAAGSLRDAVVPVNGRIVIAKILPLSISFDHRCVTGGEATRFLAGLIADLELAE